MLRRTFMQTTTLALAAQVSGLGEGIRLGFDSYSIRDFKWKDIQLLEYAAGLKLDTIQFSSLDDYASLDPAHLQKVKERAAALGIVIDAGIGSVCPTSHSYNTKNGEPHEYL